MEPIDTPPRKLSERAQRFLQWLGIIAGVGGVFLSGAVAAASRLEENDRFCASCHMAPERTYYNRAQYAIAGAQPIMDLSSAHYVPQPGAESSEVEFRCIDCHRGDGGLSHRAAALGLGARDAAIYFLGEIDQTIEKGETEVPSLMSASCTRCHADALLVTGFENHFHHRLPEAYDAWQAGAALIAPEAAEDFLEGVETDDWVDVEPGEPGGELERTETSLTCQDCHRAHVRQAGAELEGYLDVAGTVFPACEVCHTEALGGPLGLAR